MTSNDLYTQLSEIVVENISDNNYKEINFKELNNEELNDICSELYTSDNIEYRIYILNNLCKYHNELCLEHFQKIILQYLYNSNVEINELMLIKIIKETELPIELKYECVKSLYNEYKENKELEDSFIYDLFLHLLSIEESEKIYINSIIKIQIIQYLIESYKNIDVVKNIIYKFICDNTLQEHFRYQTILQFSENPNTKSEYIIEIFKKICLSRLLSSRYVILASQFLLGSKKELFTIEQKLEVENIILSMCQDNKLDYNLRADASDLLLTQSINEKTRQIALDTIILLGRNRGLLDLSIYDNKQNVHEVSIDESVKKAIEYIASIQMETKDGVYINYNDVCKEIITEFCNNNNLDTISNLNFDDNLNKDSDNETYENTNDIDNDDYESYIYNDNINVKKKLELLKASLLRISLDRSLYNNFQKIESLFIKIWQIIKTHEYKDTLITRLIEELIDMSGTCSSGHVSRLINVLSGFEVNGKYMNLSMNYKDEMTAVIMAKINKLISEIDDEKYQNDILDELLWSSNFEKRFNFNKFFRENVIKIRDEMINEYVTEQKLMDIETFEINFRLILEKFEY